MIEWDDDTITIGDKVFKFPSRGEAEDFFKDLMREEYHREA